MNTLPDIPVQQQFLIIVLFELWQFSKYFLALRASESENERTVTRQGYPLLRKTRKQQT